MDESRAYGPGRYQEIFSRGLEENLNEIPAQLLEIEDLDVALTADRTGLYAFKLLQRAINSVPESERNAFAVAVTNSLVEIVASNDNDFANWKVNKASELLSVGSQLPTGSVYFPPSPLTPLVDSAIHTNARREPNLLSQIISEIDSADHVDVIMAFVRQTGVNYLRDPLKRLRARGGKIRVLTTTYAKSTEAKAIETLLEVGAEVRISYDTSSTRLHAKSWVFGRNNSISTVYIGSSNLTHSAQVDGIEWNVRLSQSRNPDVVDRMQALFDSYWSRPDFETYDPDRFALAVASEEPRLKYLSGLVGINLRPFQEVILEQLEASRQWGHHRNLLVAATGTGKTVMAAVDYQRLFQKGLGKLLFVAHRREIIEQSLTTFRQAMGNFSFGEVWMGSQRPTNVDHVFASIQTINHSDIERFTPDHFDVLIIDEFHHAAASSYRKVLEYFKPREVLGLTATPERADGQDILSFFEGRIAADLRIWDAIEQQYLVPFQYFGISDGTDLSGIPYKSGKGYDPLSLSAMYTGNRQHAQFVLRSLYEKTDVNRVSALGFCVSVEHAEFMAQMFSELGLRSAAVTGTTPKAERLEVLRRLGSGEVRVVFSVDVFNEGLDVPGVNTVLMLRPTESPTVFLQQLGRGLRLAPGKSVCTILDFVANHRKEFRFDKKYSALLGIGRGQLDDQIRKGFPSLPSGCFMHLDAIASEVVLANIKSAIPTSTRQLTSLIRGLFRDNGEVSLGDFLSYSGLSLQDVYRNNRCWSDLRETAGLPVLPKGAHEASLRRALGRLLHVDDKRRLGAYTAVVRGDLEIDHRVKRMLLAQLWRSVDQVSSSSIEEATAELKRHPQVCAELGELLRLLEERSTHPHYPMKMFPDEPLQLHARYTREEIQAAIDIGRGAATPTWREGVRWDEASKTDLLLFTLDKSSGSFSPTTSYRDFALSRDLIHWESQSTTSEDSVVGKRYQFHQVAGSRVFLFARVTPKERSFWFLGPATYQHHVGSRPMAINWKLEVPIPADLYQEFVLAVA